MASNISRATFIENLTQSGLLASSSVGEVVGRFSGLSVDEFAKAMIDANILTKFQAKRLVAGRKAGFFLGKYKLLERLSAGGMGVIYLAEHPGMRRAVALKIVRREILSQPYRLDRFRRETQTLAAMNHSNIAQAFDYDDERGVPFLVMEYVRGLDARLFVKRFGPLHWSHAADYMRQTALALRHIHQAGYVHHDMKPSNLMLGPEGCLKTIDFGLVARVGEVERCNHSGIQMRQGTWDFAAPEQSAKDYQADPRADIYGLASTFHYLVTGRRLFPEAKSKEAAIIAHCEQTPPFVTDFCPEVPPGLEYVIRNMLAKNTNDRPQTADEVIELFVPYAEPHDPSYDEPQPLPVHEIDRCESSALSTGLSEELVAIEKTVKVVSVDTTRQRPSRFRQFAALICATLAACVTWIALTWPIAPAKSVDLAGKSVVRFPSLTTPPMEMESSDFDYLTDTHPLVIEYAASTPTDEPNAPQIARVPRLPTDINDLPERSPPIQLSITSDAGRTRMHTHRKVAALTQFPNSVRSVAPFQRPEPLDILMQTSTQVSTNISLPFLNSIGIRMEPTEESDNQFISSQFVTVAQFQQFVAATQHQTSAEQPNSGGYVWVAPTPQQQPGGLTIYHGRVASLNKNRLTLHVGLSPPEEFVVVDEAKITWDGEPIDLKKIALASDQGNPTFARGSFVQIASRKAGELNVAYEVFARSLPKLDDTHFVRQARAVWHRPLGQQSARNDAPVVQVSKSDVIAFCRWLSKREGESYRIPDKVDCVDTGAIYQWCLAESNHVIIDGQRDSHFTAMPNSFIGFRIAIGDRRPKN